MNVITTTLLVLLSTCSLFAQIKFTSGTYANGMTYPIAHFQSKPAIADSMNAIIGSRLMDAETSDFCIGDYGFFQKGNHIELHLVCNCIDFAETDHRYLFFSLETGKIVGYDDVFEANKKTDALKTITREIKAAQDKNECAKGFGELDSDLNWDDFIVRLYKDGIEIHPKSGTCEAPVLIPWTKLTSYLRFNFL